MNALVRTPSLDAAKTPDAALADHVRDFLYALDRGWLDTDHRCGGIESAFVAGLRAGLEDYRVAQADRSLITAAQHRGQAIASDHYGSL